MSRQVDGGIHLALACMYAIYKSWSNYPHEIAKIMQEILDLDRRHYVEAMEGAEDDPEES